MRTSIFKLLLVGLILFVTSCKKDNIIDNNSQTTISDNFHVSSRGFLVFPTTNSIVKFGKLLNSEKKDSLISELQLQGFINRKQNPTVLSRGEGSIYNQFFDENGFLQVSDIIMRISDDDAFLYTVKEEYADQQAFDKLFNEIYDAMIMNRINVDRSMEEEFDFVNFNLENPAGEFEAIFSGAERRPMFGSSQSTWSSTTVPEYNAVGQCVSYTTTYSQSTTYIFWIGFPGSVQTGNTVTNYNVLGCD
ncbi:MAG: hypothetical protein ACOYLO_06910 [Ferruginibacter sp.]